MIFKSEYGKPLSLPKLSILVIPKALTLKGTENFIKDISGKNQIIYNTSDSDFSFFASSNALKSEFNYIICPLSFNNIDVLNKIELLESDKQ